MNMIAKQFLSRDFCTALFVGIFVWLTLLSFICGLFVPEVSHAEGLQLESFSVRTRISGATTLGDPQPEEFQEYALAAYFGLPWERYSLSGWGVGTQLMTSAGLLRGVGEKALVLTLVPELSLGSDDGRFALDMGAGGALLSRYRFGAQDYGGPFQFALTLRVRVPLYKKLGLGYLFLHYSDAGIHGSDTVGADFHMIELSYRL